MALTLTLGATHPARAAMINWVDFSPYLAGAQSQGGFTSADGLQVDVSFSNLTNFSTSPVTPAALATATINDASWPFQNVAVPPSLGVIPINPLTIATSLTLQFTNPGGLPAGGSLAVLDLEDADSTVTITGLSGGIAVPVDWSFTSYSVTPSNVAPPLWFPQSATLQGPGAFTGTGTSANNFALLVSNRQLDALVLTIQATDGIGFNLSKVPEPGTLLLLGVGLVALATPRRLPRTRG